VACDYRQGSVPAGAGVKEHRDLGADAVYFEIGVAAYNLTVAVKRLVLGGDWVPRTIASLRWRLLQIAGKVVRHGRKLILRVPESYCELYRSIANGWRYCRHRVRFRPIAGADNWGGELQRRQAGPFPSHARHADAQS